MIRYFVDPMLRAPTIGSMLMCFSASLIGVLVFVRKRSLLGETLSHATYPGIVLALLLMLFLGSKEIVYFFILGGAFVAAALGYFCIDILKRKFSLKDDSALTFVLASFFGFGVTLASILQFTHPKEFRTMQSYLYGQAATMTDFHIILYGALSLLVLSLVVLFFKELKAFSFDREFASLSAKSCDWILLFLVVLSVVIGMRSVGIVLMSAMLIAPPVAARQYTHSFKKLFVLSAFFGLLSGFFGCYLSNVLSSFWQVSLPTGPLIVLVSSFFAIFSLLFAPKRGVMMRQLRALQFRITCLEENLLKNLWRLKDREKTFIRSSFKKHGIPTLLLLYLFRRFEKKGWIVRGRLKTFALTDEGVRRGGQIVRLHRLWEVYLVDHLGMGEEKVHKSAEEMEHILTPELERELTQLLHNPSFDPHHQPIPPFVGEVKST